MLSLIIRFILWTVEMVWCKLLRFHFPKVIGIRFARQVEMVPHMERIVIRYVDQKCRLCGHKRTRTDRARVAHDWQHPERLFR